MFDYQQHHRYFAQVAGGMEELGAEELSELGARSVTSGYRGIYFEADQATLYRVNYCARLIARVLAPLLSFQCHSDRYLHQRAMEIDWPLFFKGDCSFAVSANVSQSKIRHSQYAALRLKDAVVDRFRAEHKSRPNIDKIEPDIRFNLYIEKNRATISLDTSGDALHRRGYRKEAVEAPMQETLAAAVIRLSTWTGSEPLYDPMCGSGTLLSEALMQACHIPSGYLREKFGFERLPDFDQNLWRKVKREAGDKMGPIPSGIISGSDLSRSAVRAAATNLGALPYGDHVKLEVASFQKIGHLEDRVIVCNPPYGIRMGDTDKATRLYREFGDFLKHRCKGTTAYIYFGNRKTIGFIGLKPSWKKPFLIGGLDGRLAKFELY
ncbi:MAG: THUMP domain-containing class I SAM-dependent RNA methyltransferase [Desulfatiglandales bacterium]